MNRSILIRAAATTAFLIISSFPLAALDADWGGALSNTTGYIFTEEGDFIQQNRLSLWASGIKSFDTASLSLFAQGSYLYTNERPLLVDLDYLRFHGQFPGLLGPSSVVETSLGRLPFNDPTGYILSHTADGASVRLLFPRVRIRIDGAYTGLLLNPSSDIRISDIDVSEQFNEEDNYFGPKRVLSQGSITFTDLGSLQRWIFFALAQFDLRNDETVEMVDSQYWGTLLSFRFGRNLYHDSFLTVGTSQFSGSVDSTALSLLTGFSYRYLKESWLGSRFSLRGVLASPDIPIKDFEEINIPFNVSWPRPLNKPALGMVVDPSLDALLFAEIDYSMRPFIRSESEVLSRLQASVGGRAYFRPVISLQGQTFKWSGDWAQTNPDSDSWFLGTEYNAALTWRIFSDLSAGVTGAMFFPGDAWAAESEPELMLRLEMSLSF